MELLNRPMEFQIVIDLKTWKEVHHWLSLGYG